MPHEVYLSLGSNMGRRRKLIARATRLIGKRVGRVVRRSAVIETEPWGFSSAHAFLNAAVCCLTDLTPRQVLRRTQAIERLLGKRPAHATTRGTGHAAGAVYHDRPIDIDILLYDDVSLDEPGLVIPHPLMREREFVMRPLSEILD